MSDIPDTNRNTGSIFIFTLPNVSSLKPTIVKRGIGIINYMKGTITLNPINITSAKVKDGQPIIQISANPHSNDVIGVQDLYLQLDISSSIFEMVIDKISSGLDPSASNYIVSSSYGNGNLVRASGLDSSTSNSNVTSSSGASNNNVTPSFSSSSSSSSGNSY